MYQSQAMLIFKGTIYGNKPVLITNWSWHVLPYITGEIVQMSRTTWSMGLCINLLLVMYLRMYH